jgi:hypothetical protein
MQSFGERLKIAMVASGHRSPADLAREITKRGFPVSRQSVGAWLKMKRPKLDTEHFLIACEIVGYRPRWIAFGFQPMLTIAPDAERQARLTGVES